MAHWITRLITVFLNHSSQSVAPAEVVRFLATFMHDVDGL